MGYEKGNKGRMKGKIKAFKKESGSQQKGKNWGK